MEPLFFALIDYEDPYVQPLIISSLRRLLPSNSFALIESAAALPTPSSPLFSFLQYESIDFTSLLIHNTTTLANAYVIRKALIRKHYLAHTISTHLTKNPKSILVKHWKEAWELEVDYAEFLDEALEELYELKQGFEENEGKEGEERQWWILKPGMSDRGQGIRLFSSEEELTAIFEEWEVDESDEEDEDSDEETSMAQDEAAEGVSLSISPPETKENEGTGVVTSQLRHFIVQSYIHPPFLLPSIPKKFHLRVYIVAVGALKVYVYRDILALFAADNYEAPVVRDDDDQDGLDVNREQYLRKHLTNTCLQNGDREGNVRRYWELEGGDAGEGWKEDVFSQICDVTGEVFKAAAQGMMVHFQVGTRIR
jgi:tubulin---tyrosine ligase